MKDTKNKEMQRNFVESKFECQIQNTNFDFHRRADDIISPITHGAQH